MLARLARERAVLAAVAIVLLGLVVVGALSFGYAVVAFLLVAAVVLLVPQYVGRDDGALAAARAEASERVTLLDSVISGLPDPVVLVDHEDRVIAFNAGARSLAPALAIDQPVSLALRVPEVVESLRQVGQTGQAQRVEFSERVPVDRWFLAHVIPLGGRTAAGRTLLTFHDLSPLRRVEEMRADFVANASHELRTPLAALSGFIDTLQGPARNDPQARERFLAIMKQQASRMARLIDDLLSLSRIELNAHLHPETPVDLVAIVRQVADSLQTLARDRDVAVAIEPPAEQLTVLGDRDELTRVFENLVENALKYGASGKRVEISFARSETREGAEALVSVRDYGPGIAAEHLPRLTERFYRIDVGHSRAEGGTGLGLALVKHILNRHRGRLAIDSTEGQGATFTVRLPLHAQEGG